MIFCFENISYGLKVKHVREEKIRAAVKEALEMVGLSGLAKRGSAELSGGQQQLVAVARALVLKPKVLLFDEPLSNLDAKLRNRMRGEIRNLQRDLGITSVYVTHDQSEALAMSDKIVVMENAVISQEGKPTELYKQPANVFVADFIGDANTVEAKVIDVKNGKAHIKIGEKDFNVAYKLEPKPGETAKIMIRPEDISLQNESADGIKGMVEFALYQGSTNDYLVKTDFGELRIRDFTNKEILRERGTYISLNFREDQIFLIH